MSDSYLIYRCVKCGRHFVLMTNEVKYSEEESTYITCPYHGSHKDIVVCGKYDSIKECMAHDSYEKVKGRIRMRRKDGKPRCR